MELCGLTMNTTIVWLIIGIVFIVVEAITIGLTTIWFAIGAFVALVLALFNTPLWLQIAAFIIISICLLAFTRKFFVEKLKTGSKKTNVEALIGENAVVISPIEPYKVGRVKINGLEWAALNEKENEGIAVNRLVKVIAIEGVKLIVSPVE